MAIGTVATAAAIGLTVATGGSAAVVAVGVTKIVCGIFASTVIGAGIGGLQNGAQGVIDGACNGFMFGALSAFAGAAVRFGKMCYATSGNSNAMGAAGERLAHIDPSSKTSIQVSGQTRIPDALTDTVLTEVKNVSYLSNTQQLRDFATYAYATGRKLVLYVRPTTRVTQSVINAGWKIMYLL